MLLAWFTLGNRDENNAAHVNEFEIDENYQATAELHNNETGYSADDWESIIGNE